MKLIPSVLSRSLCAAVDVQTPVWRITPAIKPPACTFLWTALVLLATAAAQDPNARLEGVVLTQSGQPVPRASLRLETSVASGAALRPLTVTGDDEGKFVFKDIPPGLYALSATKDGFLTGRYGQRTVTGPGVVLTLGLGGTMKDVALKLTAQSVISGQVIDQDGDPVARAQVGLLHNSYVNHRWRLSPLVARAQTDDRGNFRISGLNPGRYYLNARPAMDAPQGYVTTFYPNTSDPSSAAPIDVLAGSETKAIDVRMKRESAYSVKGTAMAGTRLIVNRLDAGVLDESEPAVFVNVGPDSTFELRNVRPGPYVAQIAPNAAVPALEALSGRLEFAVKDSNVEGLTLLLSPPVQVSANIKLENGDLQSVPKSARPMGVQLVAVDPGVSDTDLRGNGGNVIPPRPTPAGRYLWDVYALPVGTFVKSARYDNQDVTLAPLDVAGSAALEIVLARNPASIGGVVQNGAGGVLFGIPVTVWPKVPDPGGITSGIKTANTDQNGAFRVTGLAPGEYYAAAWEEIDPSVAQYPEFLARFANDAAAVKLSEGADETVSLKLIPTEQVGRELAKLP